MFKPKLLTTFQDYSKDQLISDIFAGVIVGIVAIPLAIAFAIASGLSPEKGLLTAVVAGFLISVLGGSRVQIGGPTGAFVVIVYGILQQYGLQGLIVATFLAGILLVAMGLARLGAIIKFIPQPVVVGFTSGIALVIFSSQTKDFLGLQVGSIPAGFVEKWMFLAKHANGVNSYAAGLAAGTILLMMVWPRISRKIPGSFVALILGALLVQWLHWPVETIGSRFGALSLHWEGIPWRGMTWTSLRTLVQPAITIALLGGIESLLSAVVSDGMIGGRHRSNMELVAQGVANMASALTGGMPATGAIARTVTNIKNGGRTPVAGVVHALTILMVVLFIGRTMQRIPLACLAGILTVVSYHMSEWRSFSSLLRGPRTDALILGTVFLLTVFVDLTVAIEAGMVLAAFTFLHRMALSSHIHHATREIHERDPRDPDAIHTITLPPGVEVYEINGPFFFGISHTFAETARIVGPAARVRIIRMRHVPFIDATGLYSLRQLYAQCQSAGTQLLLASVHSRPMDTLNRSGLANEIGRGNILPNIHAALARSEQLSSGAQV